jgi:hypothetical protein
MRKLAQPRGHHVAQEARGENPDATEKRTVISTVIAAPATEAETMIGGEDFRWPHWVSYLNLQLILDLGCFLSSRGASALRLCASNSRSEIWVLSRESTAQLAAADPAATARFVAEWNRRTQLIDLPDPIEALEQLFGELTRLAAQAIEAEHVLFLREERYYPNRLD